MPSMLVFHGTGFSFATSSRSAGVSTSIRPGIASYIVRSATIGAITARMPTSAYARPSDSTPSSVGAGSSSGRS